MSVRINDIEYKIGDLLEYQGPDHLENFNLFYIIFTSQLTYNNEVPYHNNVSECLVKKGDIMTVVDIVQDTFRLLYKNKLLFLTKEHTNWNSLAYVLRHFKTLETEKE